MISFTPYSPEWEQRWNLFVSSARNATFLFNRSYMDYHSDRFSDASLIATENGKIKALLPANRRGDTLHSHQGLTYGGWILPERHFDACQLLALWDRWLEYSRAAGLKEILYKPLPAIYHRLPSQADEYALFRCGASIEEVSMSSTIDMACNAGFNNMMKRQLKKAAAEGAEIVETTDIDSFVGMLSGCLLERHNTTPVHSAGELRLLQQRFPDSIRIFTVISDSKMHAGVCIYDTGTVAHAQYIASTPEGRERHFLPLLFDHLINKVFSSRRWFDFGISCENGGQILNEGLLRQKTAFGGEPTLYRRYRITL